MSECAGSGSDCIRAYVCVAHTGYILCDVFILIYIYMCVCVCREAAIGEPHCV